MEEKIGITEEQKEALYFILQNIREKSQTPTYQSPNRGDLVQEELDCYIGFIDTCYNILNQNEWDKIDIKHEERMEHGNNTNKYGKFHYFTLSVSVPDNFSRSGTREITCELSLQNIRPNSKNFILTMSQTLGNFFYLVRNAYPEDFQFELSKNSTLQLTQDTLSELKLRQIRCRDDEHEGNNYCSSCYRKNPNPHHYNHKVFNHFRDQNH